MEVESTGILWPCAELGWTENNNTRKEGSVGELFWFHGSRSQALSSCSIRVWKWICLKPNMHTKEKLLIFYFLFVIPVKKINK